MNTSFRNKLGSIVAAGAIGLSAQEAIAQGCTDITASFNRVNAKGVVDQAHPLENTSGDKRLDGDIYVLPDTKEVILNVAHAPYVSLSGKAAKYATIDTGDKRVTHVNANAIRQQGPGRYELNVATEDCNHNATRGGKFFFVVPTKNANLPAAAYVSATDVQALKDQDRIHTEMIGTQYNKNSDQDRTIDSLAHMYDTRAATQKGVDSKQDATISVNAAAIARDSAKIATLTAALSNHVKSGTEAPTSYAGKPADAPKNAKPAKESKPKNTGVVDTNYIKHATGIANLGLTGGIQNTSYKALDGGSINHTENGNYWGIDGRIAIPVGDNVEVYGAGNALWAHSTIKGDSNPASGTRPSLKNSNFFGSANGRVQFHGHNIGGVVGAGTELVSGSNEWRKAVSMAALVGNRELNAHIGAKFQYNGKASPAEILKVLPGITLVYDRIIAGEQHVPLMLEGTLRKTFGVADSTSNYVGTTGKIVANYDLVHGDRFGLVTGASVQKDWEHLKRPAYLQNSIAAPKVDIGRLTAGVSVMGSLRF